MKDLKFICCQPDDTYYTWQVHLWLENLREIEKSKDAIVLIFVPSFRDYNTKWDTIISLYPEATFKVYKDEDNISKLLGIYIPVLRPYLLWRWWKDNPEMENQPFFYYDCDVLLTKEFDISKYIEDDTCYLSDTNSYINATYFDSKVRDVKPEMLEEYKTIDVLDICTKIVGVNREIAEKNNLHSGGAQYLLKNIKTSFWKKMIDDVIGIRMYLMNTINRKYFESENKGFQSWTADMWALLWGLWADGKETKVIKEMDFAWAPDPIDKLKTHHIFHNAGVTGPFMDGVPYFYKGTYHTGQNPIEDEHLNVVLNDEKSKKRCTWVYANALKSLSDKYKLSY